MKEIIIEQNDGNQRLDRFLKKYLKNATLGQIYKFIRKDIKVNGKRCKENTLLIAGDIVNLYLQDELLDNLTESKKTIKAKKQFKIAYEDDDMIVVVKPFGLLTHGDSKEKKNHLANQVIDYLISNRQYNPAKEKTFSPSPVNRLDRNTTGLVIFGKNANSLKRLNQMIRERNAIRKYYLTIVAGEMKKAIELTGSLEKDRRTNTVNITEEKNIGRKEIKTLAKPIKISKGYTLVEVELVTGRTHQIRAHLLSAGFPIIGDVKYGNKRINEQVKRKFNLTTQLLHAYRLIIDGKEILGELPQEFQNIVDRIFDDGRIL